MLPLVMAVMKMMTVSMLSMARAMPMNVYCIYENRYESDDADSSNGNDSDIDTGRSVWLASGILKNA